MTKEEREKVTKRKNEKVDGTGRSKGGKGVPRTPVG